MDDRTKSYEGDSLLFGDKPSKDSSSSSSSSEPKESDHSELEKHVSSAAKESPSSSSSKSSSRSHSSANSSSSKKKDYVEKTIRIRIPKNTIIYERTAYALAIIVLILIVAMNSFSFSFGFLGTNKSGEDAEVLLEGPINTSDDVVVNASNTSDEVNETNSSDTSDADEEPEEPEDSGPKVYVIENKKCVSVTLDINDDRDMFTTEARCEEELGSSSSSSSSSSSTSSSSSSSATCDDGEVSITIVDIDMDSSNSKRIENVDVEIINNQDEDLDEFYLSLFYYNNDDDLKTVERLAESTGSTKAGKREYSTLLIPKCGGKLKITLDDEIISPLRYVSTRKIANTFEAKIYDDRKYKLDDDEFLLSRE